MILEVSAKVGRHFWRHPAVRLDAEDWSRLPGRFGADPVYQAERGDLFAALRRAADSELTPRQPEVFVAIVLNDVPLDTLVMYLGSSATRSTRQCSKPAQAAGRLGCERVPGPRHCGAFMSGWSALDRLLRTDPRDVGCDQAMEMLHVYAELVAAGEPAEERYPGIAAHLQACGPCGEDFAGLLAAIRGEAH